MAEFKIYTGKNEWTRFEIFGDEAAVYRISHTQPTTSEKMPIEKARELYRSLLQTAPPELQDTAKKFNRGQRVVVEHLGVADIIAVDSAVGGRGYTLRFVAGKNPGVVGDGYYDRHHMRLQTGAEAKKLRRYFALQ
jgi:hypothetical protein